MFVIGGLWEQYVKYGIGARQRLRGKMGFHVGLFMELAGYFPYGIYTIWHLLTHGGPRQLTSGFPLVAGITLIVIGVGINFVAVRDLKLARWNSAHVFGMADELKSLVTLGIYSRVRHPSYLGQIVALFGCALVAPIPHVLTLAITYYLYMIFIHIRIEERYLESQFGKEFQTYRASVGALLPRNIRR